MLKTCWLARPLPTASASLCSLHGFCPKFAHVIRSSIRALADGRHAVTLMRALHPLSPPLRWAVSRAFYFLSLTSLHAPTPHAHPNSGAPINALRAQPDAQPDANAPDTKVRHRAPTRAVPPSSPIMRKPTLSAAVQSCSCSACSSPSPASVPAGWVSVDTRLALSWPPGYVRVLQCSVNVSCAQHGEFVWCACSGTAHHSLGGSSTISNCSSLSDLSVVH